MQIVQTLAGFTLGQADILRRAMGKKKAEILLAQKENFLRGCAANGVSNSLAEKIFELLSHFADYGFNKSHSAAYGLLAWQTAYLKAHFPAEYMAAIMSGTTDADKVSTYIDLSRRLGIKILPPDVNSGNGHFTVSGNAIRFGLSAIKSVGEAAVTAIVTERKRGGKFKSLADFCGRVDAKCITRRTLENLIKCGAFETVDTRRTAMLESLDSAIGAGLQRQRELKSGAINLFGDDELNATTCALPAVKERSGKEILAWEKETLGFYISGHPLNEFRDKLENLTTIDSLSKRGGKRVKIGGIITNLRQITTKRGDAMAFITLEDFGGAVEVTLFPNVFYTTRNIALPDDIVVINGRVDTSGEDVKFLAESVTAAEDYIADFWLTLPAELDMPETIDALKKIFDAHSGLSNVFLNQNGKWSRLTKKISDSDNLRGELETLLGAGNVRLY